MSARRCWLVACERRALGMEPTDGLVAETVATIWQVGGGRRVFAVCGTCLPMVRRMVGRDHLIHGLSDVDA